MEQKVRECVKQIRKITDFKPQAALILGSGLGALADEIECVASIATRFRDFRFLLWQDIMDGLFLD